MIHYIGDISKTDALVLKELAEKSKKILEFGCGASTQVLSEYTTGVLISIDTSTDWIDKTKSNINILEIKNIPTFEFYDSFIPDCNFDLIFDDGVDHLRKDFAITMCKYLQIGGYMAFHDTRRWHDQKNVVDVIHQYFNQIESVKCNYKSSNITILKKKNTEDYNDWNIAEGREQWEIGYGEPQL